MSKIKKTLLIVLVTVITLIVTITISYKLYDKWDNERHWVIADIESLSPSSFTNTADMKIKFEYNNKEYKSIIRKSTRLGI